MRIIRYVIVRYECSLRLVKIVVKFDFIEKKIILSKIIHMARKMCFPNVSDPIGCYSNTAMFILTQCFKFLVSFKVFMVENIEKKIYEKRREPHRNCLPVVLKY